MVVRLVVSFQLCLCVLGAPNKDQFKDQFCTDPRTMKKYNAYTEWADAYSCTRHRCQPGGRNLAIYTVGCKRVEAPESAIECEEVVEDTNMQFPYCCTRLRCLVVVRGEVWTRVLGQPFETLPAAPWSHMYKMKKPPPGDQIFGKIADGPVFELAQPEDKSKMRAKVEDCHETPIQRSGPPSGPDIMIALNTGSDTKKESQYFGKEFSKTAKDAEGGNRNIPYRYKRTRKSSNRNEVDDDVQNAENDDFKEEDKDTGELKPNKQRAASPSPDNPVSEEKTFLKEQEEQKKDSADIGYQKGNGWNGEPIDAEKTSKPKPLDSDVPAKSAEEGERPTDLQALVDAIGTRMRNIEDVVQKMTEKVQKEKEGDDDATMGDSSKKYRGLEPSTEPPLYEDPNGYLGDISNAITKTTDGQKSEPDQPQQVYMAPVSHDARKSGRDAAAADGGGRKRRRHHTRHKKHRADKKQRFNKIVVDDKERGAEGDNDNAN